MPAARSQNVLEAVPETRPLGGCRGPVCLANGAEAELVPAPDPRNTFVTRDRTRYENWASMPGEEASNHATDNVPHGRFIDLWYSSPILLMTDRSREYFAALRHCV
jgi:hypothetical protein